MFEGKARGSTPGGNDQFTINRAHLKIDSGHTDNEPLGNLHIGQALSEQSQHIHFRAVSPSG
jgi:hypothetical protein